MQLWLSLRGRGQGLMIQGQQGDGQAPLPGDCLDFGVQLVEVDHRADHAPVLLVGKVYRHPVDQPPPALHQLQGAVQARLSTADDALDKRPPRGLVRVIQAQGCFVAGQRIEEGDTVTWGQADIADMPALLKQAL